MSEHPLSKESGDVSIAVSRLLAFAEAARMAESVASPTEVPKPASSLPDKSAPLTPVGPLSIADSSTTSSTDSFAGFVPGSAGIASSGVAWSFPRVELSDVMSTNQIDFSRLPLSPPVVVPPQTTGAPFQAVTRKPTPPTPPPMVLDAPTPSPTRSTPPKTPSVAEPSLPQAPASSVVLPAQFRNASLGELPAWFSSRGPNESGPRGIGTAETPKSNVDEYEQLRAFVVATGQPAFRLGRRVDDESPRSPLQGSPRGLDVALVRRDFPILSQTVYGKPLVWLDNAATTQKPQVVIDAISRHYERDNSNIHRAAHTLAARSTDAYEKARETVRHYLNARSADEIVFVRGTTEGINLVAQSLGALCLTDGDEILVSHLEHHANIVPWQMIAKRTGAFVRAIPVDDHGDIDLAAYEAMLGPQTKIVALAHANNSIGTILPVHAMIAAARRTQARVLIDGAQTVAHLPIDVQSMDCDFFVFSGHKVFGPTGIGAVFAKREVWEQMPPYQGGGNMIQDVTFERTVFADPPARFEAGTPNIADAIGLGEALDYVSRLGLPAIAAYEHELLTHLTAVLQSIPGLRILGAPREKVGVVSFVLENHRPEDVGKELNREGIAVRSGHHCAQPSLRRFGLEATVRPSLAFYNTHDEIDRLATVVRRVANARPRRDRF